MGETPRDARVVTLGLRANLRQFGLLVLVNAFVGGMVGLERAVLPLLAEREFGLASKSAILSFILSFGLVKALTNLVTGRYADLLGRKRLLVVGWLIGLPVPFLIIWAPSWEWVIFANVLLGLNQGLCWSTTVIMKIDLVGPYRRGLAMGLNEFAGYGAVALAAFASAYLAGVYGLRPAPFYLGIGFALVGLLVSWWLVRETADYALAEARLHDQMGASAPPFKEVFAQTSYRHPSLSSCSQAGLVNNLNDGIAWGLFPLFFAMAGLEVGRIGLLVAIYPAVWGISQLFTGALSDRWGRKWMIVAGMWVQAIGIGLIVLAPRATIDQGRVFRLWVLAAMLLGVGTALVYPTLLAAIGDLVPPGWRASAVGVYRWWRDLGYAVGALLAGIIADSLGLDWAIVAVAALTGLSGLVVAVRMKETIARAGV